MKMNVEIECTPEEARRAIGLPDLTPIHDRYIATMLGAMTSGLKPETLEQMTRSWGPMSEAGLTMWRQMIDTSLGKTSG